MQAQQDRSSRAQEKWAGPLTTHSPGPGQPRRDQRAALPHTQSIGELRQAGWLQRTAVKPTFSGFAFIPPNGPAPNKQDRNYSAAQPRAGQQTASV